MAKKRTLSAVVQASASEGRQELNEETKSDDEHHRDAVAQDDGNDETEDSVYISVELTDFADFPILDKHDALEIENLESDRPILRIGEYVLYGTYEDALGTDVFYDMHPPANAEDATTSSSAATCSFVGSAMKRLKFVIDPNEKRQFLRKPTKI
ncbi:hypothetical protein H257_10447 [Aphanomyces astaci]|uniref:Transcription factor TFIIIC triple barrel domain-containing protein n=1 Tax=Aphanomyces astaci TaxID=112090 RepID=W4G6F1_APHAT|nr:hypothetical protein H257_10447 [Aphanomyces astaci]ETV75255.1 hypothetical protein H257_10447 [Aphanomyces astaci]RHY01750.1 hypothetical protein DYB25_003870 [Aphanomyces astaci]RHY12768.1 hypothetical protein DYB36_012491 [Aphanomyces astaci]RHY49439.1 hypothetical protein DYB34_008161 [Aphanomyces astaci]RHY52405.1 hypothetical protein DYB30_010193 [Aphanomyces astaci]|eukprot:XP_009835303.1 hypothetical protein H257_10447 [Aphanomyces astaci]